MDRYPGYESMLARVEQKKVQVKGQLPTFYSHLVDNMVDFVLDQVNECCNVVTVDATTNTTEDLLLSDGPVAPALDTRSEVNELTNPASPQVNHHIEGSISNEQSVSPPSPPSVTQSTIHANIEVKVEASSGQSVQYFKCVKKEEDEDGGEYVMECDCEECEICRVKMEMKEELDENGETELGGNSAQEVQGFTSVKKEELEGELEGERPNKMRRIDRALGNGPVGSSSPSPNVIVANVEGPDDQMSTSSTNSIIIEDHTKTCQPVTVSTPIVTSSSSSQHVNEMILRDELLNGEPMMDNVEFEVRTEEFGQEQVDHDNNSTLNSAHIDQDDEETEVTDNQNDDMQDEEEDGDETIEQRQDTSADDDQQIPVENFVQRIEPDERGNRFECNYRNCGKRTKLRNNLVDHIRTHTGEKRFRCSVEGCDRAFVRKGDLKAHLNIHSGDRPFVCTWPSCEARFGSKSNLTAHLRTHTGERPFECDQCDATFTRHGNLVAHLRIHTGARPFVCTWPNCGQAFTQSTHLKNHSFVHSNERQFVCDVRGCTKVYKHKRALRRHQKDQHHLP